MSDAKICPAPLREPIQYEGELCVSACGGSIMFGRHPLCKWFEKTLMRSQRASYRVQRCHACIAWTDAHESESEEV